MDFLTGSGRKRVQKPHVVRGCFKWAERPFSLYSPSLVAAWTAHFLSLISFLCILSFLYLLPPPSFWHFFLHFYRCWYTPLDAFRPDIFKSNDTWALQAKLKRVSFNDTLDITFFFTDWRRERSFHHHQDLHFNELRKDRQPWSLPKAVCHT